MKEYKTIVLGLGIKGGRNYKYDLKIGTHDIIKSEVVAVDGYIYTEDGDGFIGVRISVNE